jgi:hypothetical protein
METDGVKLAESIEGLKKEVSVLNSLRRSFFRGMIFGLGSAVGAGIIAALLIGTVNQALKTFGSFSGAQNLKKIEIHK